MNVKNELVERKLMFRIFNEKVENRNMCAFYRFVHNTVPSDILLNFCVKKDRAGMVENRISQKLYNRYFDISSAGSLYIYIDGSWYRCCLRNEISINH